MKEIINTQVKTKKPFIEIKNLSKIYQNSAGDFPAIVDLSLEVFEGEFLIIVGKSGAGKTTLINMISGIDHCTSGEIRAGGQKVNLMNEDQLAIWRGKNLGMIYQSFHLMPGLSLINNITLPLDFAGRFQSDTALDRALELLEMVELEDHATKYPSQLSGGQQQRVAIARAIINDPPIIVADEPTGRLDSVTAEVIFGIFEKLHKRGKTILMVTHDLNFVTRASRFLEIVDGRILKE
ncbi:MAG: ABC transporter ATP-binding protein [Anaerolineaceae bacterium]